MCGCSHCSHRCALWLRFFFLFSMPFTTTPILIPYCVHNGYCWDPSRICSEMDYFCAALTCGCCRIHTHITNLKKHTDILALSVQIDRSWFVGNTVQQTGELFLCTPMDPMFLILPLLELHQRKVPYRVGTSHEWRTVLKVYLGQLFFSVLRVLLAYCFTHMHLNPFWDDFGLSVHMTNRNCCAFRWVDFQKCI